ncbi:hypothetical protein [Aureimonas sp. ME7]|uniref:hypothetical protein n=1 Tax=Aureimonas sp. ME7 TaxID=2744252 RepID=UPI0015F89A7C|nr:hypothetical protein [Aureimonas sp. ME7]
MRQIPKAITPVVSLAPNLRAATATGAVVDRLGHEAASFLVTTGNWTDGTHTVVLQESTDGTNWAAIAAANLSEAAPVVNAAGLANKSTTVVYNGDARYLRAQAVVSGSPATGAVVGVTVLLSRARNSPAGSRVV